jgi:hypothetical protein
MRFTKPGCFKSRSWSLWKVLEEEGHMGFGSMMFGLEVPKFLNVFFIEN